MVTETMCSWQILVAEMHWTRPNKSEMESKNVEQVNDSACRFTGEKKIHLAVKVSETLRQRGKKMKRTKAFVHV